MEHNVSSGDCLLLLTFVIIYPIREAKFLFSHQPYSFSYKKKDMTEIRAIKGYNGPKIILKKGNWEYKI